MSTTILQGDAAHLPLADGTVDLIITSPPYHKLRAYQDGGAAYHGQLGAEKTPEQYLDALIDCTREWMRALKNSGSLWVNLGDAYSNKSLRGLPWRYALRCIDELGLILRAEIVWAKPNGLPESVTDRVRRSHEQVFHLVKSPRYYTAVDEIREESAQRSDGVMTWQQRKAAGEPTRLGEQSAATRASDRLVSNPLGKIPGSVWSIPTSPLRVPEHLGIDHFAAYPPELVRRIILGWSPREVCTACGEGRRPVADCTPMMWRESPTAASRNAPGTSRKSASGTQLSPASRVITGYVCGCPDTTAPTTPGVILDPMGGTGTTALVADVHGRHGITVDLSHDYCRLAQWRTTDNKQRTRAAQPLKPKVKPAHKPTTRLANVVPLYDSEPTLFDDDEDVS
jgi:DNA modification methylase